MSIYQICAHTHRKVPYSTWLSPKTIAIRTKLRCSDHNKNLSPNEPGSNHLQRKKRLKQFTERDLQKTSQLPEPGNQPAYGGAPAARQVEAGEQDPVRPEGSSTNIF